MTNPFYSVFSDGMSHNNEFPDDVFLNMSDEQDYKWYLYRCERRRVRWERQKRAFGIE